MSTYKGKGKKAAPKFEGEGTVIWESDEGFNKWGYKDILVKINPPKFLDKKFSGDDLKLIKDSYKPAKEDEGAHVVYMSVHNKRTEGHEQEPVGKAVYLEYSIVINTSKKDPSKKFANKYVRKLEVLQSDDEAEAA